jgi:hypothetical protein
MGWRVLLGYGVMIGFLSMAGCIATLSGSTGASEAVSSNGTAVSTAQNNGKGLVVDATPLSDAELAVQPPVQVAPGAAMVEPLPGTPPATPVAQGEQPQSSTLAVYADRTYGFRVEYPSDFVVRSQPAERLAEFIPAPVAWFRWLNPTIAASDLGELEPADLEIWLYAVEPGESLEGWLTAQGLAPADGSVQRQPFQTAHLAGIEVCASTLIAPGCSYFTLGGGWIYRLTPATPAGEAIIETFQPLP